jgi:hypothetical protein
MKEGVIPDRFFEYRYKVKGFLNGWHQKEPNEVKKTIYETMMNDAVCNILSMKLDDVFESVD